MKLRTDEKDLGRFNYSPLFELMKKRGIPKTRWFLTANNIVANKSEIKIRNNEPISSNTIASICNYFNCQPCDIMKYIPPEQ